MKSVLLLYSAARSAAVLAVGSASFSLRDCEQCVNWMRYRIHKYEKIANELMNRKAYDSLHDLRAAKPVRGAFLPGRHPKTASTANDENTTSAVQVML